LRPSLRCTDKERIEKVKDRLLGKEPIVPSVGNEGAETESGHRRGEDVVAEDFSIESFHRG
jgi:hypothetical protein